MGEAPPLDEEEFRRWRDALGRGPWGHDLVRLGEMIGETGVELPEQLNDSLRRLGRHFIPARYRNAHAAGPPASHYGRSDPDEAISDADSALRFVDAIWSSVRG